jgi:putative ABC transport system permease protein
VAYKIADRAPSDIPEVKMAARFTAFGRTNISDPVSTNTIHELFITANPDFLKVFDFELLEGNRATALAAPRSVILTEETAKRIYGVSSVVGRSLKAEVDSLPFIITGILKNFPSNSHVSFNLIFSESSITGQGYKDFIDRDWTSNNFTTYLVLDKNADVARATQKLNHMVAANHTTDNTGKSSLNLQPLTSIHFHSAGIEGDNTRTERKGNLTYIYVFSIVAIFVLLIACINYMNLTTARFAGRGKEIAVRKVNGARRGNLIRQFLSESLFVALIALVLALGITKLLLPPFNSFVEKQLDLGLTTDTRIWSGILITVLVVGLFAGAYPALFQSGLKPLLLLKNKIRQSKGQLSVRKVLVVFQFFLSIIMVVATIFVFMQM